MITPSQIRAARALLKWNQTDLAKRSGVSAPAITNIELEKQQPTISTLEKIEGTFILAGIAFGENEGVSLRKGKIFELKGREGLKTLMDMIYQSCKTNPSDQVLVSNLRHDSFKKWAGDFMSENRDRLLSIPSMNPWRILLHENDKGTSHPSFTELRYIDSKKFGTVGQYCFADYLAIVFPDAELRITIIQNPDLKKTWEKMFTEIWDRAEAV